MGTRADIRTQAGNDFGKPGTTFPWGDLAYPQIVVDMGPRNNQTKKAFLSAYDLADAANWTNVNLTGVSSPTPGDNQQNNIQYRWERLPGVELIKPGFDTESNGAMRTIRQRVELPATPTALESTRTFSAVTFYCIDSYVEPESVVVGTLVTIYMAIPPTLIENVSDGFAFPAQFTFIGGWAIPPLCTVSGPYPGVTHTLTQQRTASKPGELTTSYSFGLPSVPDTWQVTSPGSADRFFGIGSNTIHNAILLDETCGAGSQTVEDLPESTPNSYTPGDTLLIKAGATKYRPGIFKKTVLTVEETP